jgi:hypothetical protein
LEKNFIQQVLPQYFSCCILWYRIDKYHTPYLLVWCNLQPRAKYKIKYITIIYISFNKQTRRNSTDFGKENWNINNNNKKVQENSTCLATKFIISASPMELWGCLITKARGIWPASSSGYLLLIFKSYAFCPINLSFLKHIL